MGLNFVELNETLSINKDSMTNNRMLTNELMIDDIMVGLGYNKKRDSSVKRIYESELDWEVITATGNRLAVRVEGLGSDINSDKYSLVNALKSSAEKKFSVLVITNAETLNIYRFNKETQEYAFVDSIDILNELNDVQSKIIKSISKDSWNISVLDEVLKNAVKEKSAEEYEAEISELKLKVSELETKVANAASETNNDSSTVNSDEVKKEIDDYREQIQNLTLKLSDANEKIATLEKELDAANNKINDLSGVEVRKAEELLGVIEDNKELNRHYVGVINTELIQYDDLHTFIGRCLQKLYEIKSFEASQYIFNGDIFKITQSAVRNDIMMNNKTYDIVLDGAKEDDVLNKIRIVFSHFEDVVFRCKKIGTLKLEENSNETTEKTVETVETTEETAEETVETTEEIDAKLDSVDEVPELDTAYAEDISEESLQIPELATDEKSVETEEIVDLDTLEDIPELDSDDVPEELDDVATLDDIESLPDNFDELSKELDGLDISTEELSEENISTEEFTDNENVNNSSTDNWTSESEKENDGLEILSDADINEEIPDFDVESTDDNDNAEQNILLVGQLLQIDQLVWTEEKVNFNTIKYIGTNYVSFNINMNNDEISNEQLLCKCINAIMAIEAYNGRSSIISAIKIKDLSLVNSHLKLYTEEYKAYPRVNGTKYAIVGVESVKDVATILFDICNEMGIETSEMFVYFDSTTSSEYISTNYSYPEEAVQLREYIDFEPVENPHTAVSIVKGEMLNDIVVTKKSLDAHRNILIKSVAVKTKYLSKKLSTVDDLIDAVEQMLLEASKTSASIKFESLGNVIGEQYYIMSESAERCGEQPLEVNFKGDRVYLANIEDWQYTYTLIKLHLSLFNNTAIALKNVVNVDAINFYGREFDTAEPSLCLAVRSFVDYISLNIKK